ncbi:MAG: hypothetical protein R3C18_20755 [Planctomycetaceae bacterium]
MSAANLKPAKQSSSRAIQILNFVVLLVTSWCVMTFTHETGHVLGGWIGGGSLQQADLLPWHLPYSLFEPDPHPLLTLWCGPLLGVAVPVGIALIVRRHGMWFVAHFCLLANGTYLATAWIAGDSYLDTTKLLEHGAWPVSISLYCTLTIGVGYLGFRWACVELFRNAAKPRVVISNSVN